MADEEVVLFMSSVRRVTITTSGGVVRTGHDQQIKILIRLD